MLAHFPRAQAYLHGASVRVDAPGMNDYWCAVMVAEMAFTDEELAEDGRVQFLPKVADNDGTALLGLLDDLLRQRTATLPKEEMDSLRAFLGSRGVKAGKLKASSDFWRVAEILWPGLVKGTKNADLRDLLYQLRKLGKKQRASAQKHRHLIPVEFRAGVE